MIKRILILFTILVMVSGFSMQAQAELQNLGVDSVGNRLIYDSDFDITWYDYTKSYDTWQNQVDWADALSVTFGSITYDDWRLPTALNQDGSGPCFGYNCTGTEMGHLYYTELGTVAGNELSNTGDFQHLMSTTYWTGTEVAALTTSAWYFGTHWGFQNYFTKDQNGYAIAVIDGMAVAPEPISSTLFIVGGATLGFRRFRETFKK